MSWEKESMAWLSMRMWSRFKKKGGGGGPSYKDRRCIDCFPSLFSKVKDTRHQQQLPLRFAAIAALSSPSVLQQAWCSISSITCLSMCGVLSSLTLCCVCGSRDFLSLASTTKPPVTTILLQYNKSLNQHVCLQMLLCPCNFCNWHYRWLRVCLYVSLSSLRGKERGVWQSHFFSLPWLHHDSSVSVISFQLVSTRKLTGHCRNVGRDLMCKSPKTGDGCLWFSQVQEEKRRKRSTFSLKIRTHTNLLT